MKGNCLCHASHACALTIAFVNAVSEQVLFSISKRPFYFRNVILTLES